jgi:outer membrane protein assembly factor BamB
VYAVRAGSRGDLSLAKGETASPAVAWSHPRGGTYLPTPILYGNHLVTLGNNGILTAYRSDTGEEVHRARIGGANASFSASPIAADGRLYVCSEDGNVFVVRGEPGYELLTTLPMGEVVMATPAVSDGLLVVRTLNHIVGIADDGK